MPIYEYECQQCGHRLEKLQKVTDTPLKICPECQQDTLGKLVSKAGFRLKGSGWYETDFKSNNDKKRNLAGTDSSGDNSSETKANATASNNSSNGTDSKKTTSSTTSEK